jgi:gentisate 1,2-dioxygenase
MDSPAQTSAKAKADKSGKAKVKSKNGKSATREAYYAQLSKHDMAPLWVVLKDIIPDEPKSVCAPAIWHFKDVKPIVMEASEIISAKEATRRVIVLENPSLRGQSRITQTLYAGLQLIMPGEIAPVHRHTPAAIRFILDGEGAYTQVEGEKTIMAPGDFVLTPNWCAHDHGNTSKQPMIWLDVLDVPTINFFETCFYQHYETEKQNTRLDHEDSLVRYGSGVLPDGADVRTIQSPIVNYPYKRMRPILDRIARSSDIDPRHGARFRYANPLTGSWSMPTMGAHLALLPKNFKGRDYKATDSTIFVCVEGKGTTKVGGKTLEWGPRDVFVVPSWQNYSHTAAQESVLFSISDRPAQEALGIWREAN